MVAILAFGSPFFPGLKTLQRRAQDPRCCAKFLSERQTRGASAKLPALKFPAVGRYHYWRCPAMGSVSSTSSNLSNLLQTLSAASPELSSMLSGPQMQTALAKASPGDLVQLSDQALELQQVGSMFGSLDGTQSTEFNSAPGSILSALSTNGSTTQPDLLLQALDSSLGITGTNGVTSSSTGSTS